MPVAIAMMLVALTDLVTGMVSIRSESQRLAEPLSASVARAFSGLGFRHRYFAGRIIDTNNNRVVCDLHFFGLLLAGRIISASHLRIRDGTTHSADTQHKRDANNQL